MAHEIADDMGMPTPDLNKHFLEAVIHMFAMAGAVIRPKAEYDQLVAATSERKASEIQAFDYECGQEAWRVMVKKNNTSRPVVPCAVAAHDRKCRADDAPAHRSRRQDDLRRRRVRLDTTAPMPTNPVAANYGALPRPIREALAVATAQALEDVTGFKVKIEV